MCLNSEQDTDCPAYRKRKKDEVEEEEEPHGRSGRKRMAKPALEAELCMFALCIVEKSKVGDRHSQKKKRV